MSFTKPVDVINVSADGYKEFIENNIVDFEEFDEYLDIKYLIENLQFTRIKDNESNGEPLSMTQEFTPKRIAHVKSKREKFSILLYALLCLVIINMTLYSGIELYMTNKNTASMMDNLTSKIIYTGKE